MPLVLVVEPQAPTWAQQIVRFLQTGELPEEPEEAERVARQSSMYQFVDDTLYRRRLNGVKLKCIHQEDGQKLLAEIHGGICGHHIGARALAGKAFRQGFFWPEALQDATAQITKCEACQSIPSRYTSQLKLSRRSLYPGHFRSGGSISSAPFPELSGALSTCRLQSTGSQSGRKWNQ